jgi:hypothetical protein
MQWHQKNIEEIIKAFGASRQGFSAAEAQAGLEKYGLNELIESKKKTLLIFLT